MLVPGGYRLSSAPGQIDVAQFRQLVQESADPADPTRALTLIETALELWRDDPLSDVPRLHGHPLVSRLVEEKIAATLLFARICAAQDAHQRALPLLRALSESHTLHEPVHLRLIAALAETGHQAEALAAYGKIRGGWQTIWASIPGQSSSSCISACFARRWSFRGLPGCRQRNRPSRGPVPCGA
ncbi:hypothetical protein GCM10027614_25120 [Micromonospora vulcania]